jgi:hypothetical protein
MRAGWLLLIASCGHATPSPPVPVRAAPSDHYALTEEQPALPPDSQSFLVPPEGWFRYSRPELTIWFPGHPTVADETTGLQAYVDDAGRFFVVSYTTLDGPAYARTPEQILERAHRVGCDVTERDEPLAGIPAHWFRLHYRREHKTEEIVIVRGDDRVYNLGVSMPDPYSDTDAHRFFTSFRPM